MPRGFQFGVAQFQFVVGRFQLDVLVLQTEDLPDADQIDALVGQFGDSPQPLDVVIAVTSGAACGARRCEKPYALIQAQRLRSDPGQFGGHRDAVHAQC